MTQRDTDKVRPKILVSRPYLIFNVLKRNKLCKYGAHLQNFLHKVYYETITIDIVTKTTYYKVDVIPATSLNTIISYLCQFVNFTAVIATQL